MDKPIVTNVFWSGGYANRTKLLVLYSDNTYEVIRLKYKQNSEFKKYLNTKIFRIKKYTKEDVHNYIFEKIKELEES